MIVDDSDPGEPRFQPDSSTGLTIHLHRVPGPLLLGRKRNLSRSLCRGEIIVVLDDDDDPRTRVADAVEQLQASHNALIAGRTPPGPACL